MPDFSRRAEKKLKGCLADGSSTHLHVHRSQKPERIAAAINGQRS